VAESGDEYIAGKTINLQKGELLAYYPATKKEVS
jgi:hypothetical protein